MLGISGIHRSFIFKGGGGRFNIAMHAMIDAAPGLKNVDGGEVRHFLSFLKKGGSPKPPNPGQKNFFFGSKGGGGGFEPPNPLSSCVHACWVCAAVTTPLFHGPFS